jgi:hypothetical protein
MTDSHNFSRAENVPLRYYSFFPQYYRNPAQPSSVLSAWNEHVRTDPTTVSGMQQQQRPPGMGGMQMAPGMMNVPRPGMALQQQMPPGSHSGGTGRLSRTASLLSETLMIVIMQ